MVINNVDPQTRWKVVKRYQGSNQINESHVYYARQRENSEDSSTLLQKNNEEEKLGCNYDEGTDTDRPKDVFISIRAEAVPV